MPKLLGHLAQFSSFAMQGEVLCTQGLACLLQGSDAKSALKSMIETHAGVGISDPLEWFAEARQEDDKTRPDLEARTPDKTPRVKIEAKLGAKLDAGQFRSYAKDLQARSHESGVLLALVPRQRIREATNVVTGAFNVSGAPPWLPADYPNVAVTVVSWDDVLDALKRAGSEPLRSEVEQLEAMYKVLNGDDILPLAGVEDLVEWRKRESDFINLMDRASRRLTTHHNVYPIGVEPLEQAPEGLEPKGYRRRYTFRQLGTSTPHFSLGVRDPFTGFTTPIWMRFHKVTPQFPLIRDRLMSSDLNLKLVESGGHVWIPLEVPLGVGAEEMVSALVRKAEEVAQVAYQPLP